MKKYSLIVILHVLLPLIIGGSIYFFFRNHTWLNYYIFQKDQFLMKPPIGFPSKLFLYVFPDFCWSYSFTSATLIWGKFYQIRLKLLPLLILCTLIICEAAQVMFKSYFTFDWFDMIAAILAFILSMANIKYWSYEKK